MPASASLTAAATTSVASDSPEPLWPLADRALAILLAARQTGHHAHSGASSAASGGSFVAVAQLSACLLSDPRSALLTCPRSEEHTSELQSRRDLVCRLLLEKKKKKKNSVTREEKK